MLVWPPIEAIGHTKWGRDLWEKKTLKCRRNYNSRPSPSISQVEIRLVFIQYHSLKVHLLFLSNLMGLLKYFLVDFVNYLWQNTPDRRTDTKIRKLSKYRPHSTKENEDNVLRGILQLNTANGCRQLLNKVSVNGRELTSAFISLVPLGLGQHCLGDYLMTVELCYL